MLTVNKITLLGYVGGEPDSKTTAQGLNVTGLSVATSTKKKTGEQITQWHNCVAFGKTAELVNQYAKKGSKIYIDGEMQYSSYEKDGVKMTSSKVVINNVSFIDISDTQEPRQQAAQRQKPRNEVQIDDSDIPF